MTKSRIALAVGLFAVAGAANAEFTLTPAITTDYDFRGLTQSNKKGEFQLGLNNTFGDSGVYLGAWGSQIDYGKTSDAIWELDVIAGKTFGDASKGVAYDVGVIYYSYPGADSVKDLYELYAGVSSGMFSGKLSYAPDNNNQSAFYAEGAVAIPLSSSLKLGVHAGYSFGQAWSHNNYTDYSVGFTKTLGKFDFNLKYVNSNELKPASAGRNAWIGTVSTVLPWK